MPGGGREKAVLTDTKVSETGNQEIARKVLSPLQPPLTPKALALWAEESPF